MFSSKDLFFTPAAGYTVSKSLRFRASATAYLNRTFSTPTNVDKWTFSAWIKRTLPGTNNTIFSANTNFYQITYDSSTDTIQVGTSSNYTVTNAKFRDPSAWGHVIVTFDSSLAATSRCKIYFNGSECSYSSQGFQTNTVINSAIAHYIGRQGVNANYLDGYLAEVNFIDGSALTPSSFGAYDTNGIWQPAAYTGSYGNNGFYLKFTDVGATSGSNTGYGKDFAGTNYWTTNNFGTTSNLTTYDSMLDSPTNATGDIGNYCVLNPLCSAATCANGNLQVTEGASTNNRIMLGSIGMASGKWYWEVVCSSGTTPMVGIASFQINPFNLNYLGGSAYGWGYYSSGQKYNNGTAASYGASYTTNDVIGIAFDADAGTLTFYRNNASQGVAYSSLTSGPYFPASGNDTNIVLQYNFGQRPFAYTPPSGYSALNTQNLSTPTITNGAQYMAAVLYNGTSASNTVTASSTNSGNNPNGTTFQPDLVWIKSRSAATAHEWTDVVRGVTKSISSNSTAAEATDTNGLTAFTSSGFTVGSDSNYNNGTGPATYVAWEWKAGNSSGSSNTSGSITSTVSANTTAGFSIATFTQPSASPWVGTVGHGLGATPSMIIYKDRNAANSWLVYHSALGATQYLYLSSTIAATTGSNAFNNTAPTSSVFTTAAGSTYFGNSGATCVAYCFAPITSYSSFGSYTGNGSADGVYVYTGMRPRWLLIKRTDTAGYYWWIWDTSRNTYNATDAILNPNVVDAEASGSTYAYDLLSNGFKVRTTSASFNASGGTYIYAAFAENPFKISRAR